MELNFDSPVILVGDGPINAERLRALGGLPIIAVDGGANALRAIDLNFEFVMGDMDSIAPELLTQISNEKIIRLDDQNACDFEKVLAVINAPKIYGFGFLGGRLDHSIEALRIISMTTTPIDLIGVDELAFVWPAGAHRNMSIGQRVSLLSFGKCHVNVSFGLTYPLDGLTIEPSCMSLSNEVADDEVAISFEGAPLVAIISN